MSGRTTTNAWRNVESDFCRVREKTNSRQGRRFCIVCGVDVPPQITPNGAKVFTCRCPAHQKAER
jgi:hypothetical protein